MEISYLIKTLIMVLSIITALSIIIFICAFISNLIPDKKSRFSMKKNSPIKENKNTRISNNKNSIRNILFFEKKINDENPFDDVMLVSHSIQEN
jgi:hypothetical protein